LVFFYIWDAEFQKETKTYSHNCIKYKNTSNVGRASHWRYLLSAVQVQTTTHCMF